MEDPLLCVKHCFACGLELNTHVARAIWNGMVCCKRCARVLDPDGFRPVHRPVCPHCGTKRADPDSVVTGTVTCENCSKDYCIIVTKTFVTYEVPECTCGAHKKQEPVTIGDFLDKAEYCGCLKPRPRAWTEEDEQALREEFTVRGSCGCDGALDFGCPNCEPKQFHEWWMKRLKERIRVPVESKKCSDCQQPLSFTTGRNVVKEGDLCDDCFYGKLGEEIDAHPIGRPLR